ncbi:FadR family transcriptional regulator [Proteobacteria bacterium 005FR1]|nr:FadR family transcriptional regulator [Proteobacteria bacterium 005FR1]
MSSITRSHEIAAVLRTEILRKQYRPGERLPSERDLAGRFQTTRGAIREALKQLEQLGIIDIQPGGVRVLPKEEASLEILSHLMELEGPKPKMADDFLQVFEVLCVLSAKRSIAVADEDRLSFIQEQIMKMKADPGSKELMRECWTALSSCFLAITDNLVMRLIINGLKGQLAVAMSGVQTNHPVDVKRMTKILNGMNRAVKTRNPEMMGSFVGQYFEWVREVTIENFSSHQATAATGS